MFLFELDEEVFVFVGLGKMWVGMKGVRHPGDLDGELPELLGKKLAIEAEIVI